MKLSRNEQQNHQPQQQQQVESDYHPYNNDQEQEMSNLINKSSSTTSPEKNSAAGPNNNESEKAPLIVGNKNENNNSSPTTKDPNDETASSATSSDVPEDHYHIVYFTLLFLGVALLLTYNSFVAAPDYTSHYYKYAAQDQYLNATMPSVWRHISPFITAANMVPNLFCQIAMLSNFVQKIPTLKRLYAAILLNAVAMLMVPLTPLIKVDEHTALSILLIGDAVCGGATALLQSSAFAIAAQFPIEHMQATMLGIGVSGTVVSLLQIITYAGFGSDFDAVLKQSTVFFGIGVLALIVLVIILPGFRRNKFARHFVLEWRKADALDAAEQVGEVNTRGTFAAMSSGDLYPDFKVEDYQHRHHHGRPEHAHPHGSKTTIASQQSVDDGNNNSMASPLGDDERQRALSNRSMAEKIPDRDRDNDLYNSDNNNVEAGYPGGNTIRADGTAAAGNNHEDSLIEVLVDDADKPVDVMRVLSICKGNMFANFFVYFVTLIIFPGLGVDVKPDDQWYGIIIIFLFNFGDFSGRMLCRFPSILLNGKDHILQIISGCRVLFLPIFFLSVKPQVIEASWIPMVVMYLVGITNGYTSAQLMMFTPSAKGLRDFERPTAGSAMSLSLLAGCAAGSLTALLLSQTYLSD